MSRDLITDTRHPHTHSLRLFTTDHVPCGKRAWEVNDGRGILEVADYDGGSTNPEPWTSIELREVVADKRGQDRSKTISITLNKGERAALIALLTRGDA